MELFRRKVKTGSQTGKQIGYPTLNFNIGNFSEHYKPGVYKSEVIIDKKSYIGVLYFGSKLSHKGNVLEVYIINYNGHIYGQYVRFSVGTRIRSPKQFTDLKELKKQIEIDIKNVI